MFGDRLKELRKERNVTQEELGKICGVAKNTVSYWENNTSQPSYEILEKIAKYFNVSPNYLLGFNQDDLDKIAKLKSACQEAGLMAGQDFTLEEFEKAMMVVETLRDKKNQ